MRVNPYYNNSLVILRSKAILADYPKMVIIYVCTTFVT